MKKPEILLRLCMLLLILLLSGPVSANEQTHPSPLPEFTALYKISSGSFTIGETTRTLTGAKTDSDTYIFQSTTRPASVGRLLVSGEVVETSVWAYLDGALVPLKYSYLDSSKKKPRDVRLGFDWEKQRVTNTINGDPWNMSLGPATQDKLLYQLQLMLDLESGKTDFTYNVADGGLLKEYQFEVSGRETVKIPLGSFETIRVSRNTGKRFTTFWCAESLNYLPVKIEHGKIEETPIRATLESIDGM